MRDDYEAFKALGAEIIVVTRHDADAMRSYWAKEKLPFLGVADPEGKITERYGQQWKLFSLGRMPAQVIVDCQSRIVLSHYGGSMSDILTNTRVLELLEDTRSRSGCPSSPAS